MRPLPAVIYHEELPDWIISSLTAAYHPYGNVIHIRKDQGTLVLIHEYLHWAICFVFGDKFECLHNFLDWADIRTRHKN